MSDNKDHIPPYLFPVVQNDVLSLVAFIPELQEVWPELSRKLTQYNVKTPMSFFPPELQLETLFYLTCRAQRVPTTTGNVYNLPLTLHIINALQPDALVSTSEIAEPLLAQLKRLHNAHPFSYIYLIGEKSASETLTWASTSADIHYYDHPLRDL